MLMLTPEIAPEFMLIKGLRYADYKCAAVSVLFRKTFGNPVLPREVWLHPHTFWPV